MVKEAYPAPPSPSPAKFGPFLMKIEQFITFAIFDSAAISCEWIEAVWRNPCSTFTEKSMASSTFFIRTSGITGINCSLHTIG